jgi:hypothetical protein
MSLIVACMHFDSRLPHAAHDASDREAVLLYIGTPSVFSTSTKSADRKKSGRKIERTGALWIPRPLRLGLGF